MNTQCTHCGESFERETGFYFGAMYASYGLYATLTGLSFLIFVVYFGFGIIPVLGVLIPLIIIAQPLFFRLGRLIWINIFVDYDQEAAQGLKKAKPRW